MGLKGNPVISWSGPAAVIPISTISEYSLSTLGKPLVKLTGKAGRDRESQKTCLDQASRKSLRGKRL
ncbi:hypothetical protein BMS3Abin07_00134 [bacterium BMS3Abin07]|nr:hypothetical protein BMS3Abin07_00134 [bacterium BMS3Abin07]